MSKGRAAVLAVLAKHEVPVITLEHRPWRAGNETGDGLEGGWIVNGHDFGFRSAHDLDGWLSYPPGTQSARILRSPVSESQP